MNDKRRRKEDKKKKKEKDKKSRQITNEMKRFTQRCKDYARILTAVDVNKNYEKIPKSLLANVINSDREPWPTLEVVCEETGDEAIDSKLLIIKESIMSEHDSTTIMVDDKEFNLYDISLLYSLDYAFRALRMAIKIKSARSKIVNNDSLKWLIDSNALNNTIESIREFIKKNEHLFLEALSSIACFHVAQHFNYQSTSFYCTANILTHKLSGQTNKINPLITVKSFNNKPTSILVDGSPRKVYQCYLMDNKITPILIKPGVVGNKELKVYIQEHALIRIQERLKVKPIGYAYYFISHCMHNPKIIKQHHNSFMVEYYYFSVKVGYLLVTIEDDIALIRSFKFITMEGTPEFNALRSRLKCKRDDFEYLGLDSMEILLNSDISENKKLRPLLEECGLGPLFSLSNVVDAQFSKRSIADDVVKYFKLQNRG